MNFAALKSANFRTYILGNVFALNALWMQRVTIGWLAWDQTGAAGFVGLVAFVNFGPTIVLGPLFGVLIDRINVKKAALTTQSLLLLVAALLLIGAYDDRLTPMVLLAISAFSGVIASAHNPVRMSLAPRLVPRELLSSVVTLVAVNFNLARLTGPAIGGWTIAYVGITASLAIQMLCYLPFLLAITLLKVRPRRVPQSEAGSYFAALSAGIRHVLRQPLIYRAILVTGVMGFITRGTLEILPVLADGVFDKGASGLGILTSAAGFGALMAGLVKAVMPGQVPGRLPRSALLSAWIGILMVPFLGLAGTWELALALICGLGFTSTMTGVSMQTAIQLQLEDDLRGRVMSIWGMVAIGAAATGAAVLGSLADLAGIPMVLSWAGGLGAVLLGALILRIL